MSPIPEPKSYVNAQSQNRDTVLITPGSPLPDFVPEGAKTYYTRRGIVLTSNPAKAERIHNGTDEDVAEALFGVRADQTGRELFTAVVKDAEGTPVSEIALNPMNTLPVMDALRKQVPMGGLLAVEPKNMSIQNRLRGLLNE